MRGISRYLSHLRGPSLMFAILLVGIGLAVHGFLSPGNWLNIVRQSVVLALLTYGMSLTILAGGIDISVGSVLGAASVLAAVLLKAGVSLAVAGVAAVAAGALFGAVSGYLVTGVGIPPFIATLGMLGMARGVALILSHGQVISGLNPAVRQMISGKLLGLPAPFWIILVLGLLIEFVLQQTPFGTSLYAIGGNTDAAHLAGIPVGRNRWLTYVLSGALAGAAGLLMLSRFMAGDPMAGDLYDFDALAAAVAGGIAIKGGRGAAVGALLGVLIISMMRNGMDLMRTNYNIQVVAVGVVIILAYLFDLAITLWWPRRRRIGGAA